MVMRYNSVWWAKSIVEFNSISYTLNWVEVTKETTSWLKSIKIRFFIESFWLFLNIEIFIESKSKSNQSLTGRAPPSATTSTTTTPTATATATATTTSLLAVSKLKVESSNFASVHLQKIYLYQKYQNFFSLISSVYSKPSRLEPAQNEIKFFLPIKFKV